jgi:hypothetical protein
VGIQKNMEKIMNILPSDNETKDTLWMYKDNIEVFNKFNQYVVIQETPSPSIPVIPVINHIDIKNDKNDNEKKREIKNDKTDKKKDKIESPLDLIIRITEVNKIMKNDIKEKLIEFISLPEFSKAFGMKKSSEIMNGLTKDSWNQSTSLFISFLLDKTVIYKEKSYIYNKEKINQVITVC